MKLQHLLLALVVTAPVLGSGNNKDEPPYLVPPQGVPPSVVCPASDCKAGAWAAAYGNGALVAVSSGDRDLVFELKMGTVLWPLVRGDVKPRLSVIVNAKGTRLARCSLPMEPTF